MLAIGLLVVMCNPASRMSRSVTSGVSAPARPSLTTGTRTNAISTLPRVLVENWKKQENHPTITGDWLVVSIDFF